MGNKVEGNRIGDDGTCRFALGNGLNGVEISSSSNNTIGGTEKGAGNLISGNAQDGVLIDSSSASNKVEGNLIGTDATGKMPCPNGLNGVEVNDASNNTIGGSESGAGNVISANDLNGVLIANGAIQHAVEGNKIGVDITGTAALGNQANGVVISDSITGSGIGSLFVPPNNTIGGTETGAGNIIDGNAEDGVLLTQGASFNHIEGNIISGNLGNGVDVNGQDIIDQTANNEIGGTEVGASNLIGSNALDGILLQGLNATMNKVEGNQITGNVEIGVDAEISGNRSDGIRITGGTNSTAILGNFIGTDQTAMLSLANQGDGIHIVSGPDTRIGGTSSGDGNVIAFNALNGVGVLSGTGKAIRENSIFSNGSLGIDLGDNGVTSNDSAGHSGPNLYQNFPELTSAVSRGSSLEVQGSLSSIPNATFAIDFFDNPVSDPSGYGQGQTFLGTIQVTTDSTGQAAFDVTLNVSVPAGHFIATTAADPSNNTSEFSACAKVTGSILQATGTTIAPVAGAPFNGAVASFTDQPVDPLSSYSAVIAWGDGVTSSGTVVSNSQGGFDVLGSHTYAAAGTYTLSVTIDDADGTSIAVTSTANVTSLGLGIQANQTAGFGFWANPNGQALIASFNGGGSSTALGDWLASNFSNLFGSLSGQTNTVVTQFYQSLFNRHSGPPLAAQVMATALNAYATTQPLGGDAGQTDGFAVSADGLGAASFDIGTNGTAFGVPDNTTLNVYQLLQVIENQYTNGAFLNGSKSLIGSAVSVFDSINQAGAIG